MNKPAFAFLDDVSEFEFKQTLGADDKPYRSKLSKFIRHTGGENPLEYEMRAKDGEVLAIAQEQKGAGPVPYSLRYNFIGKRRPMSLVIKSYESDDVLYIKRPFHILASTGIIKDHYGETLGYIWRRFDPIYRHYEWRTNNKQLIATIRSPFWKFWNFAIMGLNKRPIGFIRKKTPSGGEYMTYRDTIAVECANMSLREKIMALAQALTISIDLFGSTGHI